MTPPSAPPRSSLPPALGAALAFSGLIFLNALYGGFGEASLTIALCVGAALALLGVGTVIGMVRGLRTRPPLAAIALVLAGTLLHAWQALAVSEAMSWGLFLWAMAPYVAGLLLSCTTGLRWAATGTLAGSLLLDIGVHRMVFVHPAGSTASLGLVFAPLLILCVGMPVILGVAYTVQALRRNSSPRPSLEP